jgi:hypothetical protein
VAHWNKIRDEWRVELEQARAIPYIPQDLIDRYARTGDICDWERIIKYGNTAGK